MRIVAIAELPSRFGRFQVVAFWNNRDGKEHIAIMHGDPRGKENVPTRVHSECLTGDAIGSLRCDCRDDEREYSIAAHMLFSLEVRSIRLLTNNPKKVDELSRFGVKVSGRLPHMIPPNEYNRFYLETRREESGHILDPEGRPRLPEQGEPVQVEGGTA